MKRTFLAIIILTMFIFSVSALDSSFDIGVNLSYNRDSDVVDEDVHSGIMKQISVGLEMRGNISNFQTTLAGELSVLDTQSVMFSGIFGAGLSVDMFKYLKLGVTVGPKVSYVFRGNVKSLDDDGDLVDASNFWDAILEGQFHYRLMLDILAGPVMSLGFVYTLPTEFTMNEADFSDIIPTRDLFSQGQISLCINMKVF